MHFIECDVLRLFAAVPYLALSRPDTFGRFLHTVVRDGVELTHVLHAYPQVRYQPSDYYYVCLQCLGALDERLVADLVAHYTWRGVVWAAWLVALSPAIRFRSYLEGARSSVPHDQWIVDLALCEVDCTANEAHGQLQRLLRRLRSLLDGIPRLDIQLRAAPSASKIEQLRAAAQAIRENYRSDGAPGALAAMRASAWPRFL